MTPSGGLRFQVLRRYLPGVSSAGPDAGPAVARGGRRGSGGGGIGLRARVAAALAVMALAGVVFVLVGDVLLARLESQILTIYSGHVLPLRALKSLSDAYAVDVVDTLHKVAAGRLDPDVGAERVSAALVQGDRAWNAYRGGSLLSMGDAATTEPLLDRARAAGGASVALIRSGDLEALRAFNAGPMYPAIEPLTQRLDGLVTVEVAASDASVHAAEEQMRSSRIVASIVLILGSVTLFGVGLWFSRRVVTGVDAIDAVVRRVTVGDFSQRVRLEGDDELARTGAHVDLMIDALVQAKSDLVERSAALDTAAQRAMSANAAKTLFLSSMTHELRTPLNVILGYAQLLGREPGRSRSDRLVFDRVSEAGEHLLGIISTSRCPAWVDLPPVASSRGTLASRGCRSSF